MWVVAFVAQTCGSCTKLAAEWETLTRVIASERRVKLAYVDMNDENSEELIQNHTGGIKIQYTPTVLFYGQDKSKPVEYEGNYKFDTLYADLRTFCKGQGIKVGAKQPTESVQTSYRPGKTILPSSSNLDNHY